MTVSKSEASAAMPVASPEAPVRAIRYPEVADLYAERNLSTNWVAPSP